MARLPRQMRQNGIIQRSEEAHIFPYKNANYHDKATYVRELTRRKLAQTAGLPEERFIDPALKGLGSLDLPIAKKKNELIRTVHKNPVTILEGDTGSGKTTQSWQYLLGEGYERIFVLVPRISIAENIYARAIEEITSQRSAKFAHDLVGMAHGDRSVRRESNKVTIMTAGSYFRSFNKILEDYSSTPFVTIGDEIHEGDVEIERAVAVTASMLGEVPTARLILSSATQNLATIRQTMDPVNGRETPVVHVEGRPFDIEIIEEPELTPAEAYVKYAWNTNIEEGSRKTLSFAPGKKEIAGRIENTINALDSNLNGSSESVRFLPLHAKLTRAAMANIYLDLPEHERLMIASSSAGQSGITIPGVNLVISDGLARRPELDSEGAPGLMTRYSSQAEIIQQFGRSGRDVGGGKGILVKPGKENDGDFKFIPLEEREAFAPAQIYSMNTASLTLNTIAAGYDPSHLNNYMMNDVSEGTIIAAKESLYRLGALDDANNITDIGMKMDKFPVRPEYSRGIVEAINQGYPLENVAQIAAIAASLDIGGLAYFSRGSNSNWKKFIRDSTTDDFTAQLDMFVATRKAYLMGDSAEEWLSDSGFDPKNVKRAHKQWDKMMNVCGWSPHDIVMRQASHADKGVIHKAMLAGLVDYVYEKVGSTDRGRTTLYKNIFRSSQSTERKISTRSRVPSNSQSKFIIGSPRRYEIYRDGEAEIVHILDNVIDEINVQDVAKHARHLITEKRLDPKIDSSGRLETRSERRLGSIQVGRESTPSSPTPTKEGADLLYATSKESPGPVQRKLRGIAHELSRLANKVPSEEHPYIFQDYPLFRTADIDQKIHSLSRESRSLGEIENGLRAWLYENNITLEKYAPIEVFEEIAIRSPRTITLRDGRHAKISYEKGEPLIRNFILDDILFLPDDCKLPDGREIKFQYIGGDKSSKIWDISDLHAMKPKHE